jgi:hypothetical protein
MKNDYFMNKTKSEHTNKLANKIVNKSYQNSKNKNPFTQAAENAKDLLSHTYNSTTGKFDNSEGDVLPEKEAVKVNEFWDKNLQDQKKDDYLKNIKKDLYKMDPNKKGPQYVDRNLTQDETPKVSNPPILQNNVNGKKFPNENNPTVNRYKAFKENKKKQLEEKKFNEEFEREYSDKAIEKYVRSKVHKNRQSGKADYEDLPTSYLIVGEAAKDEARKKLDAIKASGKLELKPDSFIQKETIINDNPQLSMPSLDEWMRVKAPIEKDPPGITGLNKVKRFKRSADLADQKFPKQARGIGPFLTGEDD